MMTMKERRELYKKQMSERHQESFREKDDSGRFRGIFESKADVNFWRCTEDDHEISIVPYLTGKKDPKHPPNSLGIGLFLFVHRGVGVNENSYICLNRTYGKPCPICEYQKELKESTEGDVNDDLIKSLNPTKRAIYNVVCYDSAKEEGKGVQVWDVSHYLFSIPLEELAHKKKGGGDVPYGHHEEGKIISFRKKGSKRNTEFTAFEFKDRDPLEDEILEAAYCLDDLIHKPTYEEVHEAFWAGKSDGKSSSSEKEEEEEERPRKSKSREEEGEEEEEERPRNKSKVKEEEDEEEEDVPESVTEECPEGAAFGEDYMGYPECKQCDLKAECKKKSKELKEVKEEEEEEEEEEETTKKYPLDKKKKLFRRDK